jgi:type I restriction enzyme R subunit
MARYHDQSIDSFDAIRELSDLARVLRTQTPSSLSPEEEAYFDALCSEPLINDALDTDEIERLSSELTIIIDKNETHDWTEWNNSRAKIAVAMKKTLRRSLKRRDIPQEDFDTIVEALIDQARRFAEDT